jgi:hypothetical protein
VKTKPRVAQRWGDYRDSVVVFLAGVYLAVKLHGVAVRAGIALAFFALAVSGCGGGDSPSATAWVLVAVLLLMGLGIFYLIKPRK